MAQAGLHGIIGLATVKRFWPNGTPDNDEVKTQFKYGLVLGNMIPDVDFFVLGPMYLIDSAKAMGMHRTFTHSLITLAVVTGAMYLWHRRDPRRRAHWLGLGTGWLMHILVDILIWFSGVEILWPLRYLGVPDTINLWAAVPVPGVVSSLLGAFDYFFFALYYYYLIRTAARLGTDAEFLPTLKKLVWLQGAFFVVYTGLSFALSPGLFNIAHYAVFILFMFPLTLWVTRRMYQTIAAA